MLDLSNFGHINKSTNQFESRDKTLLVTSSTWIMMSWRFLQNTVILRSPAVATLADIIKIITRFIKQIIKDSSKVKKIRNYVSKWNLYLYFLIQQNLLILGEKMLTSAKTRACITWLIYFLIYDWFIILGYVWQILRRGTFPTPHRPPICEYPRKCPSWVGLKSYASYPNKLS